MNRRKKPWTNEEDKFLVENYDYMTNQELADALNRTVRSITYRLNVLFLKRSKPNYAYYRDDEFVASGTKEELAEMFGVTESTIQFYASPTYAKRGVENGYGRIRVVRV